MKVIIHDLGPEYEALIEEKSDRAVAADGKYALCQGCFGCWTKHPAECFMKDKLQQVCRVIGQADELVIVTKNLYGAYSAAVKNILDRSIGTSTPFSTYRGRQMHHTLRYGKHDLWKVVVYGEVSEAEKATFRYMAERNAINDGYARSEVIFLKDLTELEASL
ncbi:MAG: flavodoxin family protein [Lachnospiraceae bacterium]|nr:flavodoxin family protein [Blautia sp.]MBQ9612310.1 flavodoxin family protein [Lachnospiraceae bacterium]